MCRCICWGCRNKVLQTWWLKTTEVHSLIHLESVSRARIKVGAELRSLWSSQGGLPPSWSRPAPRDCRHCWTWSCVSSSSWPGQTTESPSTRPLSWPSCGGSRLATPWTRGPWWCTAGEWGPSEGSGFEPPWGDGNVWELDRGNGRTALQGCQAPLSCIPSGGHSTFCEFHPSKDLRGSSSGGPFCPPLLSPPVRAVLVRAGPAVSSSLTSCWTWPSGKGWWTSTTACGSCGLGG